MKNIRQQKVKINKINCVGPDIYLLDLESAYLAKKANPGNFIHIKIESALLRRPFSVHKVKGDSIFVLFNKKGRGTNELANKRSGDTLDVIGPLGKGFVISQPLDLVNSLRASSLKRKAIGVQNILVAGGIGVAPLVFLAEKLREIQNSKLKIKNVILLGGKTKSDVFCEKEFKKLGFKVEIATDDGSKGRKGNVVQLLRDILQDTRYEIQDTIYACGPKPMFQAMHKIIKKYPGINCQVSFEQFMGCGLGFCCGCVIETKKGYKKVCKDGPVFNIDEIW